jgi:hypothetical protein
LEHCFPAHKLPELSGQPRRSPRATSSPSPPLLVCLPCRRSSTGRVNRQLQPGGQGLNFSLRSAPPAGGKQQRRQAGLGPELQLAGQWGRGGLGTRACALAVGDALRPFPARGSKREEEPDAGAASAGALSDSSSRAAALCWPEAPSSSPRG